MNNNYNKFVLHEHDDKFYYKKNKKDINISFNRVAFVFFVFLISIIYSIHLLHLESLQKTDY